MLVGSLEENVLALLCYSTKHAMRVALEVNTSLFSTSAYRTIATEAVKYLTEYNKPPKAHLSDILETQINKGDEGVLIATIINGMADIYPSMNEEYIVKQLAFFSRKAQMTKAASSFAELVHKGKLDEAMEALTSIDQSNPDMAGTWAHMPDQMLAFLDDQEEEGFTSGIEELDIRNLVPARKTMTVLIGAPKRGKSWFLINIGKECMRRGYKVLHISLENSERLTAKRYIMAIFAMASRDVGTVKLPRFERADVEIRSGNRQRLSDVTGIELTDSFVPQIISQKTKNLLRGRLIKLKRHGRLKIKEFPTNMLTIGGYNQYLDYLERSEEFIPDIVLLDYPDLMSIPGNDPRIGLGTVFKSIRGAAVKRNHAVVCVTQSNRSGAQSKVLSENQVGEDFSKIATADAIITFNQTRQEKQVGLARILVARARDAEDQYFVSITQAYAIGQFCLDSAYLTNDLKDLAEKSYETETDND